MTDLIKREDAIEALGEEPYVWTDDDEFAQGERSQWISDVSAIKAIPSAQPKQGEWYCDKERGATGIYMICSACDESIYITGDFKYCPNCGARMKGADDETD